MSTESNETVEHKASDLTRTDEDTNFTKYSVSLEGHVYAVKARTVAEAEVKAKKMHKARKGQS